MGARFKVAKRRCYFFGLTHNAWEDVQCTKKSTVNFPDVLFSPRVQPLCQNHARKYFGDREIDRLLGLGLIRAWWKRSQSKDVHQDGWEQLV